MMMIVPARATRTTPAASPHRAHWKLAAGPGSIGSPNLLIPAALTSVPRRMSASRGRIAADGGKPGSGLVELPRDHPLDVVLQRSVRAQDDLTQHRQQRQVLAGPPGQARPGGVEQPDGVIGDVRHLFSGTLSPLSPETSFAVSCGATVSPPVSRPGSSATDPTARSPGAP
jgi:hypothetical protein